jgi:hypothetical protein
MFLIEKGEFAYLVSVIQMEKGTGPKNPDQKYFQNLMKNYTEGSTTTLRASKLATIAGKPGIDGVSDTGDSAHQVQILVSGDRVYMVIYVGTEGEGTQPRRVPVPQFVQADQLIPAHRGRQEISPSRAERGGLPYRCRGVRTKQEQHRSAPPLIFSVDKCLCGARPGKRARRVV